MNRIITGECRTVMRDLIEDRVKVQCVVTSPPYWGLRAYGTTPQVWGGSKECEHDFAEKRLVAAELGRGNWTQATNGRGEVQGPIEQFREPIRTVVDTGQCVKCGAWRGELGLEPNPIMYVRHMVEVFRLVRDLMADNGTCFINIGDTYITRPCGGIGKNSAINGKGNHEALREASSALTRMRRTGLKLKDMALVPERLAIALQDDGWWVRRRVIWHKTNPMPESVRDRFTVAHEHVWMLAKSERYFFNRAAVQEPASPNTHARMKRAHGGYAPPGQDKHGGILAPRPNKNGVGPEVLKWRNMRDVWSIPTAPYKDKHYATFPPALARRCIQAGTRPGDVVFDPFIGSGTVAQEAVALCRLYLGIDLDPRNESLQARRLRGVQMEIAV